MCAESFTTVEELLAHKKAHFESIKIEIDSLEAVIHDSKRGKNLKKFKLSIASDILCKLVFHYFT